MTSTAGVRSPFVLAASAQMIYGDLPMLERVRRIHERGLAVEIWDWRGHDVDALATLADGGVVFTSMTGYTTGRLGDPDGADELLATAAASIEVGRRIGARALNLHGTGLGPTGLPVTPVGPDGADEQMWRTARDTLRRVADLGEREGVTFVLENLNLSVDHPGTPFARAADTLDLVSGVDSPHLRLNLDLYHAQIGEGDLIGLCRRALPWIGEVQVADVPGRCEPGTGEIRYEGVAAALEDMGYRGVVGLEAFASGGDSVAAGDAALEAFVGAFSGLDGRGATTEPRDHP
ncbi:TIM barrel protein [Janibacter melonis]|uniref:TIM barrel protein n=1 Tax=Janibacter melonis TaxID=262209 RepID=UPI001F1BE26F|nr:TIM barrel protein [Janibacter melonis]